MSDAALATSMHCTTMPDAYHIVALQAGNVPTALACEISILQLEYIVAGDHRSKLRAGESDRLDRFDRSTFMAPLATSIAGTHALHVHAFICTALHDESQCPSHRSRAPGRRHPMLALASNVLVICDWNSIKLLPSIAALDYTADVECCSTIL
jgi:hypothetical protein